MEKRAARALRAFAICLVLDVARMLAFAAWRALIVAELRAGGDYQALIGRLDLTFTLGTWSHMVLVAIALGASLSYAFALRAGRRVALAGAALLVLHAALTIAGRATVEGPIPIGIKLVWFAAGASLSLAAVAPLAAAHLALRAPLTRIGAIGAAGLFVVDAALSAYSTFREVYSLAMQWTEYGLAVALAGFVLAIALRAGSRLARSAEPLAVAAPLGAIDGTALRALGWSLLARIALAVLIQIAIVLSLKDGDYDSAGTLTGLGAALSVLLGLVIVGALVAYLRYPQTHRSDAIGLVIGLVVLGMILEVVAARAGVELFGTAASAKRATSFWAMPSLSKLEELQSTLTWVGRGALGAGVVASFALASSLLATARVAGSDELVRRAQRVRILIGIAGVSAIGLGALLEGARGDALPVFVLAALALLGLAVFLLAEWLRLLFGLADAVERGERGAASEPTA